jgi:hypothetical protein
MGKEKTSEWETPSERLTMTQDAVKVWSWAACVSNFMQQKTSLTPQTAYESEVENTTEPLCLVSAPSPDDSAPTQLRTLPLPDGTTAFFCTTTRGHLGVYVFTYTHTRPVRHHDCPSSRFASSFCSLSPSFVPVVLLVVSACRH